MYRTMPGQPVGSRQHILQRGEGARAWVGLVRGGGGVAIPPPPCGSACLACGPLRVVRPTAQRGVGRALVRVGFCRSPVTRKNSEGVNPPQGYPTRMVRAPPAPGSTGGAGRGWYRESKRLTELMRRTGRACWVVVAPAPEEGWGLLPMQPDGRTIGGKNGGAG